MGSINRETLYRLTRERLSLGDVRAAALYGTTLAM